jgi:hypothetical protein
MKTTGGNNPLMLPPADALALTDAYREDLRKKIDQGLQSLREGKTTDGEAFMAGMDVELAKRITDHDD